MIMSAFEIYPPRLQTKRLYCYQQHPPDREKNTHDKGFMQLPLWVHHLKEGVDWRGIEWLAIFHLEFRNINWNQLVIIVGIRR